MRNRKDSFTVPRKGGIDRGLILHVSIRESPPMGGVVGSVRKGARAGKVVMGLGKDQALEELGGRKETRENKREKGGEIVVWCGGRGERERGGREEGVGCFATWPTPRVHERLNT